MENASVALLMLDIASAKSTLKELQQACTAANEEHQRTKNQLHDLEQELDVNPLYIAHGAKGSAAAADLAIAQQLQALHTENLQLKSLLKQEIESRQQLETCHSALLEMLRSSGVLLSPAAEQMGSSAVDNTGHGYEQLLQHAAISQQAKPAAATVEQIAPLQPHAGSTISTLPAEKPVYAFRTAASSAAQQTANSASVNSFTAAKTCFPAGQLHSSATSAQESLSNSSLDQGLQAQQPLEAMLVSPKAPDGCATCITSAYFPQLYQQPGQVSTWAIPAAADSNQGVCDLQRASKPAPSADTCQGNQSSQQQGSHRQLPTQQQQDVSRPQRRQLLQQQQVPVVTGWGHLAPEETAATGVATPGSSHCSTASVSTTSNQSDNSHASELLDSEDLEDLACLCDGLMEHQPGVTHQPDVLAAAVAAVAAAVSAAGGLDNPPASGACLQRSTSVPHISSSVASAHQQAEKQQQMRHGRPTPGALLQTMPHSMPQANLPCRQVPTGQLQHLQQQVAMGPYLMRHHSSTSSSSTSSNPPTDWGPAAVAAATISDTARETVPGRAGAAGVPAAAAMSQQQPLGRAAPCGLKNSQQRSMQSSGSHNVAGGRSNISHVSSNVSRVASSVCSSEQQGAGAKCAGVMADLQQQLAQRMLEVKQRLSNICNGMLEEALAVNSNNGLAHEATTAATAAAEPPVPTRSPAVASASSGVDGTQQHNNTLQATSLQGTAGAATAATAANVSGAAPGSSSSWGTSNSSDNGRLHVTVEQHRDCTEVKQHASGCSTDTALHQARSGIAACDVHGDVHIDWMAPAAVGAASVVGQQPEAGRRARVGQQPCPAFALPHDVACMARATTIEAAAADGYAGVPAAAAPGEQQAPAVVARRCCFYAEETGDFPAAEGACSDSSWSTCEGDDGQQHRPHWQQHLQQQHGGFVEVHQYRQAHAVDTPQGTPDRVRGCGASNSSASSDTSSPRLSPSAQQEQSVRSIRQQQQQQKRGCASESLEGVLFGIGGRVAAEVSQTFSPLKVQHPQGMHCGHLARQ